MQFEYKPWTKTIKMSNWEKTFLEEQDQFPVELHKPRSRPKKSKASIPDHVKREMEAHEIRLAHMRRRIRDQYSKTERKKNPWDPEIYPTFVFRRPGDVPHHSKGKSKVTNQADWNNTISSNEKDTELPTEEFYEDFKVRLVDHIAQNEIFETTELEKTLQNAANEVVNVQQGINRSKILSIIREIRIALDLN